MDGSSTGSCMKLDLPSLPVELQGHIFTLLPPNERALSRGACRAARDASNEPEQPLDPQHCTVHLSELLPDYIRAQAVEAFQEQLPQLTFRRKVELLSTAAASGCLVNLEVALQLVQATVFPQLLLSRSNAFRTSTSDQRGMDPGRAAVRAGHVELLPWLLRHCPALVDASGVLEAAAEYSDLAGVQRAHEALMTQPGGIIGTSSNNSEQAGTSGASGSSTSHNGSGSPFSGQAVLAAAAGSTTPDAVAKVQWLLDPEAGVGPCSLDHSIAEVAARGGNLSVLRWIHARGCTMGGSSVDVLGFALECASLDVLRWLVEEAGHDLPCSTDDWGELLCAAATSGQSLAKIQWLAEKGAPLPCCDGNGPILRMLRSVVYEAVLAGQAEAVRYIWGLHNRDAACSIFDPEALSAAVPGSPGVGRLLAEIGVPHSYGNHAYWAALRRGDLATVQWLAEEAKVSAPCGLLAMAVQLWPAAESRGLPQAVRLLKEVGFFSFGDSEALRLALELGNLELVRAVKDDQDDFASRRVMMAAAAKGGCEAVLDWAHGKPTPALPGQGWSFWETFIYPEGMGDFMRSASKKVGSPYIPAAVNGDLATLTALRRLPVPWGSEDVLVQAVREGVSVPALRWLVEQGAPVGGVDVMEEALRAALGQRPISEGVVAWLRGLAGAKAAEA